MSNVEELSRRQKPRSLPSGNGTGDGEWKTSVEVRLAKMETELSHLATRAWVLGGVVGGMVAAATVTIAIIRLFS